jgi:predicted nucleic acid-binding protein
MIVVDSNILLYLYLPSGPYSQQAEQLLHIDSEWVAPWLWRSEFRNALTLYLRQQQLTLEGACLIMRKAENLMREHEYEVSSVTVLTLAATSGCTAYDCEFVVVAQELKVPLVTVDKKVIKAFPNIAIALEKFVSQS